MITLSSTVFAAERGHRMTARFTPERGQATDPRIAAGKAAESQAAHYLHREFARDNRIRVIHDLRIVDREQAEHDGTPGVCQVDHLVIHRWGLFIVECKSVSGEITVRDDGAGGDEWTRTHAGRRLGMPSPIRQAERQGHLLKTLLRRQRERLRKRSMVGLRTLSKLVGGSEHGGFGCMPVQVAIAISDNGRINRRDWSEPENPFRTILAKADLIPGKIRAEIECHRTAPARFFLTYGTWSMSAKEVHTVADFLEDINTNAPPEPTTTSELTERTRPDHTEARCKNCGGRSLEGRWGRFGYYWACRDCGTNTAMPTVCSGCGAVGRAGDIVRIHKRGPVYIRACSRCGLEQTIWASPSG